MNNTSVVLFNVSTSYLFVNLYPVSCPRPTGLARKRLGNARLSGAAARPPNPPRAIASCGAANNATEIWFARGILNLLTTTTTAVTITTTG